MPAGLGTSSTTAAQTGRSHDDEPFAVARGGDVVRSPDFSAWKSAWYDGVPSADGFHVLSVDGTTKIAMGLRRRDSGKPLMIPGCSQQDLVDQYVRADNAYVAGCCPGPCRGAQRQQTPCCRVRPGRWGACALGSRGQRVAGVARRPVVFISVSPGRRAGHVPSSDEVRGRGLASRFSRVQDAPSACQQVQRVLPFGGLAGRGRPRTLSRRTAPPVRG